MLLRPALREYRTWSIDSRRWHTYEPRNGDIVIATTPKCGTTWMQQIVASLIFQDAVARPLYKVSPWIDARFLGTVADTDRTLAAQAHRRFLKSHMPADGLPLYDEVRYIHVARDGRDALMSMHNHYTGYGAERLARFDKIGIEDPIIAKPFPRLPADPASFFRLWLSTPIIPGEADGMPGPSFFDLEVGYWAERGRPNVLLVHYNDLLNDRDEEMRRVAAFLEIEVDETVWPTLVQAASFEHMREAASELMPQASNVNVFFNKGTNGRWRNLLTEDDLALYDAKVREKFTPQLASWLENGRQAVGGDPSDIAG